MRPNILYPDHLVIISSRDHIVNQDDIFIIGIPVIAFDQGDVA